MKIWVTEILAVDPLDGELKRWCGQDIQAPTFNLAVEYCQLNGLGYLKVLGELISEIPCKEGTYEADMDNIIHYDNAQDN